MKIWILIAAMSVIMTASGQQQSASSPFKITGQWRSFYMGTINSCDLRDFHALATGGKVGLSYSIGNWSINTTAYASIDLGLQDLTIPDPITGRISRYESSLVDITDPSKRIVALLGEANVYYRSIRHQLKVGRMKINTSMLNPQDGRMIPTLTQGIWYDYLPSKSFQISTGLLNAIAPRSTDQFAGIGESLGLYPLGRNLNGAPSGYYGNIDSRFIWISYLSKKWSAMEWKTWNYWVDQVFNTTHTRVTFQETEKSLSVGVEWLHQERLKDGGNAVDSLTYFSNQSSNILGAEVSYKISKGALKLGYNFIMDGGRFLFPREWGREGIYTFQKRERSEGSADNHALLLTYERRADFQNSNLQATMSLGHQWKSDVTYAANNKYAQPSYRHLNLDFYYTHNRLSNLRPELLFTYKMGMGDFPDNPNFIINKVDMVQLNFIVNYNF